MKILQPKFFFYPESLVKMRKTHWRNMVHDENNCTDAALQYGKLACWSSDIHFPLGISEASIHVPLQCDQYISI